jgi:hypothetical protein
MIFAVTFLYKPKTNAGHDIFYTMTNTLAYYTKIVLVLGNQFHDIFGDKILIIVSADLIMTIWSAKANGRVPKTCLGQVFNYKLGCFDDMHVLIYVDARPHL